MEDLVMVKAPRGQTNVQRDKMTCLRERDKMTETVSVNRMTDKVKGTR